MFLTGHLDLRTSPLVASCGILFRVLRRGKARVAGACGSYEVVLVMQRAFYSLRRAVNGKLQVTVWQG